MKLTDNGPRMLLICPHHVHNDLVAASLFSVSTGDLKRMHVCPQKHTGELRTASDACWTSSFHDQHETSEDIRGGERVGPCDWRWTSLRPNLVPDLRVIEGIERGVW